MGEMHRGRGGCTEERWGLYRTGGRYTEERVRYAGCNGDVGRGEIYRRRQISGRGDTLGRREVSREGRYTVERGYR